MSEQSHICFYYYYYCSVNNKISLKKISVLYQRLCGFPFLKENDFHYFGLLRCVKKKKGNKRPRLIYFILINLFLISAKNCNSNIEILLCVIILLRHQLCVKIVWFVSLIFFLLISNFAYFKFVWYNQKPILPSAFKRDFFFCFFYNVSSL